jgi:hypothetical protein
MAVTYLVPDVTLAEFLLARITEDEQKYPASWAGLPRFLEWCRVQRSLVVVMDERLRVVPGVPDPFAVDELRRMAALYSRHPDYDPAWRVDTPAEGPGS